MTVRADTADDVMRCTGSRRSLPANNDAGGNQVNPRRLDPANINDVLTCDQNHDYGPEQMAFDGGKMDKFVTTVGTGSGTSGTGQPCHASDVMNYYERRQDQAAVPRPPGSRSNQRMQSSADLTP